jgi:hypothetical protein
MLPTSGSTRKPELDCSSLISQGPSYLFNAIRNKLEELSAKRSELACKSKSGMTLPMASPPTLMGEDGKTEAETRGEDWHTTSAQDRDCVGRGGPADGERLRDETCRHHGRHSARERFGLDAYFPRPTLLKNAA